MWIILTLILAFVATMVLIAAINAIFALLDIAEDGLITLGLWVKLKRKQLSEMAEKDEPKPKPKIDVSNDWMKR